MPRGDRTGPMGMGPVTGRGMGFCTGFVVPGYMNSIQGYGFGRDRGFRKRFCLTGMPGWMQYSYPAYGGTDLPVANEREILANRAELLENQLKQVKKRLKDLNDKEE